MARLLKRVSGMAVWLILLLMLGGLSFTLPASVEAASVVKVGACPDLSGPTSEVGRPFAQGVRGYFNYINSKGGINGHKIEYLETDGSYDIPKETAAFKRFSMDGIVAFIGWSGGGHLQIAKMASAKKIVVFGGSISEIFADAKTAPYSFIHCASYDQIWRAMIDRSIKLNPGKKLRAVLIYPDNGYGHQNADICRKYLKQRGVDLVGEEIVGFKDIDATTQMLKVKRLNPDIALCPQVEPSKAVIMRDAKKVGIDTKKLQFYVNLQGMGPVGVKLGGKNIEDVIGGSPFSSWEETKLPGIMEIHKANPKATSLLPWYMHGWSAAMVISEGIRGLGNKEVTGEGIKNALETMKSIDTGGITSTLKFTPTDHIGGNGVKLYKPDLKKGLYVPITGFIYTN